MGRTSRRSTDCPRCRKIVRAVLRNRDWLGNIYGLRTTFDDDTKIITFVCPDHGPYTIDTNDPEQVGKLEYNTPLRNLIRALVLAENNSGDDGPIHVRVTGSDYAGFYQERVLHRPFARLVREIGINSEHPPVVLSKQERISICVKLDGRAMAQRAQKILSTLLDRQRASSFHGKFGPIVAEG
ncbi:hypothetical protein BJ742DRAFT_742252 [Cladochytrium replicatum]|nr:hypothetical protein BJ742DRAFT_742252 [Cladochytrium replicatum]